jgi:U2 small nuclear ribonucleoprotein B''
MKRKGQAFIVFDSQKSCLEAVEEMTGFPWNGKNIKVQMAKSHSDETIKRKGTQDQFEQHKKERLTLKGTILLLARLMQRLTRCAERKLAEEAHKALTRPAATAAPRPVKTGAAAVPDEYVRPNKTLFLQQIASDIKEDDLTAIFERFDGFREVRYVAVRGVGFAEYENEQFAITAKEATNNMPLGKEQKPLKVTFQRQ